MTRPRRRLVAAGVVLTTIAGLGVAHAATLAVSSQRLTVQDLTDRAPTTCTLRAAADTHVRQNSATNNYGTSTTMFVRSANANRRLLVRFDLSTCAIPSTATVQSATLTLVASNAGSTARTYDAYRTTATWTETGVTWNNKPAYAASATDSTTAPTVDGAGAGWDVGPDVASYVAGSAANYGWTLRDAAESAGATYETQFATDESSTSAVRPALVVKWTP